MNNVNVVINARFLTQPISGVQRFAMELSKELKLISSNIIFITPKNIIHKELAKELQAQAFGNLSGHFWEQLELPYFLHTFEKKPLLVNLANTGPMIYGNSIVTIHDLSFKLYPEAFSWRFRLYYTLLTKVLSIRAKSVLSGSCYTVINELVPFLKIPIEKIHIINSAVQFKKAVELTKKLDLENYILCVGSLNPRKNLTRLIRAFKMIENNSIKLVIAGGSSNVFSKLNINKNDMLNNVIFTGYISDSELIALYKSAKLFVFPSIHEGFGIPPLEAMSFDCPVIASSAASIPEVCGDAAIYFDPLNEKDIVDKINLVLSNQSIAQELIKKGKKRVQEFSWEKSAKKLWDVINEYI